MSNDENVKVFQKHDMFGKNTGEVVGTLVGTYGDKLIINPELTIQPADIWPADGGPSVTTYLQV